eukprot:gene10708-11854_t
MLMKTASDIKRFEEERGYGAWFNQLFLFLKTRDSYPLDQAVEPPDVVTSQTSTSTKDSPVYFYVPVPIKRKQVGKVHQFNELIAVVNDMASKNLMAEILEFAKQEPAK